MVGSQDNQAVVPLPILVQRINQSPKVEVKIVGALEIEQLLLHEVLVLIVAKAFREMMRIRRVGRDGDGGDECPFVFVVVEHMYSAVNQRLVVVLTMLDGVVERVDAIGLAHVVLMPHMFSRRNHHRCGIAQFFAHTTHATE